MFHWKLHSLVSITLTQENADQSGTSVSSAEFQA
jgi:hypothetical protein